MHEIITLAPPLVQSKESFLRPLPDALSEPKEEIPVPLRVLNVHKDAHQLIAVHLPAVLPRPSIFCVSEETAPNLRRSSTNVSAISASGIGLPSLNRSGSRISNRRPEMLIRRLSLNFERNAFAR